MPATPVKIGPFNGGLNTYSEPTAVGDNEFVDVQNFDVDLDGSLYSRAPITILDDSSTVPAGSGFIYILGWFIDTNMTRYLIVTYYSGASGVYARNEETGVWTTITTSITARAMVQYNNKAWLISNQANPGGSWDPVSGFVADADIPKGEVACIYKERLFIGGNSTNPNRVYFSNAADFGTWNTSVNFFDVRAGDGQKVVKLVTFQDTVVCFKNDSTYAYSYDSNPDRGTVRLINGAVGCANKLSVAEYENSLYILYDNNVYQMANWNFTLVNLKVPFEYYYTFVGYTDAPLSLSIMADRLVIHYYDNIYVFGLRTGVWTKWAISVDKNFNYFVEVPRNDGSEPARFYAGCRRYTGGASATNHCIFEWRPEPDGARTEEMECYVVTKVYDFNVPYTFKRLFHWGVDLLSQRDLTYTVHPITYSPAVTHNQMAAYTHDQITGNHLRPLDVSIDVSGSKTISNVSGARSFVKLIKSLRFRQIYFTVGGTTDGTTVTGPVRLYSIIAFVDNKQLVSKELS